MRWQAVEHAMRGRVDPRLDGGEAAGVMRLPVFLHVRGIGAARVSGR